MGIPYDGPIEGINTVGAARSWGVTKNLPRRALSQHSTPLISNTRIPIHTTHLLVANDACRSTTCQSTRIGRDGVHCRVGRAKPAREGVRRPGHGKICLQGSISQEGVCSVWRSIRGRRCGGYRQGKPELAESECHALGRE